MQLTLHFVPEGRRGRTVCVAGSGRIVAAVGVVNEVGDRAGADRGEASGAERKARADASHAEAAIQRKKHDPQGAGKISESIFCACGKLKDPATG